MKMCKSLREGTYLIPSDIGVESDVVVTQISRVDGRVFERDERLLAGRDVRLGDLADR